MATLVDQMCVRCGYTAIVSGRDDAIMAGLTTTILCLDCKELMDVMCGTFKGKKIAIRCGRSRKHTWVRWESGGPCPKCGGRMKRGENFILVD
jgi:hypothetical protein